MATHQGGELGRGPVLSEVIGDDFHDAPSLEPPGFARVSSRGSLVNLSGILDESPRVHMFDGGGVLFVGCSTCSAEFSTAFAYLFESVGVARYSTCMSRTVDLLPAEVEAVREVWSGEDAASLSDSELVAVNERYCRMRRMLDADQAQLAAEIARRSRPCLLYTSDAADE